MTLAFDTLRAARRPRAEGGFDEKQAAILVETFSERTGETLATKVDLEKTEASLRGQMRELEQRMTICLGATLVGTVVVGQRRRSGLAALRPSGSQFHSTAQERLPPARRDEVRFPDACRRPPQHVSACAA